MKIMRCETNMLTTFLVLLYSAKHDGFVGWILVRTPMGKHMAIMKKVASLSEEIESGRKFSPIYQHTQKERTVASKKVVPLQK